MRLQDIIPIMELLFAGSLAIMNYNRTVFYIDFFKMCNGDEEKMIRLLNDLDEQAL